MRLYISTEFLIISPNVFKNRTGREHHTRMDQEQIKEAEVKVEQWLADKHHRHCVKAAMCAANAVILMGLTAGLAILWINELRRANSKCHCGKSDESR